MFAKELNFFKRVASQNRTKVLGLGYTLAIAGLAGAHLKSQQGTLFARNSFRETNYKEGEQAIDQQAINPDMPVCCLRK